MAKVLEICVDSYASARAAIAGGADRLELCSALLAGGLTPYDGLLRQIKAESDIPVRCLMRTRPGDFLYTPQELALLRMQILQLKAAGADEVIFEYEHGDAKVKRNLQMLLDAAEEKRHAG